MTISKKKKNGRRTQKKNISLKREKEADEKRSNKSVGHR